MVNEATFFTKLFALQPAVVRGFIVTVIGLIAASTGAVIDDKTTTLIITFVMSLLGIGAALFIKPAVTPNAKVVVADDTPLDTVSTLKSGPAVSNASDADILAAAKGIAA